MGTFANIQAKINARMPAPLADGALTIIAAGELEKFRVAAPPAIALELQGDNYAGPRQGQAGPGAPGSLWTCETNCVWHIWHEDIDSVHELRRQLVASIHDVMYGSYRLNSGTWDTLGASRKGVVYMLKMAIWIPIVRDEETTAVISTMPNTPEIEHRDAETP